uniref:DNA polymerase III subunit tau n=1 Tax=Lygus hesperus TaxID=30085 RepID=A0A0A9X7V9_LYGHE
MVDCNSINRNHTVDNLQCVPRFVAPSPPYLLTVPSPPAETNNTLASLPVVSPCRNHGTQQSTPKFMAHTSSPFDNTLLERQHFVASRVECVPANTIDSDHYSNSSCCVD